MTKDKLSDVVLDMWKREQCPDCRAGNRSKCSATRETAKAYRIDEKGATHYYCFMGCLMLELDDAARKKIIESSFNVEGHYEQMANEMYTIEEILKG